jgi:hypothetical protein
MTLRAIRKSPGNAPRLGLRRPSAAFLPAGTGFSPLFKAAKCGLDSGSHPVTNCDRITESPTTGFGAGKFAVRNLV